MTTVEEEARTWRTSINSKALAPRSSLHLFQSHYQAQKDHMRHPSSEAREVQPSCSPKGGEVGILRGSISGFHTCFAPQQEKLCYCLVFSLIFETPVVSGIVSNCLGGNSTWMAISLVVHWMGIHLPMQGTWVWSLVWEDSTWRGQLKPMCHNYWAHVPQLLSPCAGTTEACASRARALQQEKPPWCKAHALQLENSPCSLWWEKAHM